VSCALAGPGSPPRTPRCVRRWPRDRGHPRQSHVPTDRLIKTSGRPGRPAVYRAPVQRISGGSLRGRVLRPLAAAPGLRPTGARVREAIFDRLQHEIRGAAVLDLFAGSGALAFEALSRGARRATLVEHHPTIARNLLAQIRELALGERATVWQGDA